MAKRGKRRLTPSHHAGQRCGFGWWPGRRTELRGHGRNLGRSDCWGGQARGRGERIPASDAGRVQRVFGSAAGASTWAKNRSLQNFAPSSRGPIGRSLVEGTSDNATRPEGRLGDDGRLVG